MTEKPRVRVLAGNARTTDSFQNFAARVGLGTDNLQTGATYGFNPISRNRQLLEWMYSGSWVVKNCVDLVAEDMTRAGIEIQSKIAPDDMEKMSAAINDLCVWPKINETIKWSRLYGGAIAVLLVEGQKLETPFRPDTVGQDQFKGLAVLDRWMLQPSLNDLITAMGPDMGEPKFYDVVTTNAPLPRGKIHHSRVIRLDGLPQPFWRKIAENGWGLSVIEPLYDRLVAFDSTTNGAAQLVHKAHLRTIKIDKLRETIAIGGKAMEGLAKQMDFIRLYQTNEGLTLLDASDEFDVHSYTFAGLDDILLAMGQQIAGATGIPLVRLFGEAPAGLNSSGDSDFRNYYDSIKAQQEARLRRGIAVVIDVTHRSIFGKAADVSTNFSFVPLWQMSEKEKGEVATSTTTAVTTAYDSGVIDRPTALKELRQSAPVTGVFSNITDEDIEQAELEPPPGAEGLAFGEGDEGDDTGLEVGADPGAKEQDGGKTSDAIANFALHGLGVVIETPKGAMREGPGWSCTMAAHYGYIQGTWSAEGRDEEMDCFVGPDPSSRQVFVIDQIDPDTGEFDEHKCMLGYLTLPDAARDYMASYSDRGFERMDAIHALTIDEFKAWLSKGRLDRALADQPRPHAA